MRAPHETDGGGLPPLHLLRSALVAASVCDARGAGASAVPVAVQLSALGSYLPPVLSST